MTTTATAPLPTDTATLKAISAEARTAPVEDCAGCGAGLTVDDLNYGGICSDGITDEPATFGDCCWTAHLNGCGACLDDHRSH